MFQVCPNCKVYHFPSCSWCDQCGYLEMDADEIRLSVDQRREAYEAYIRSQHPTEWIPDRRTLDIYCLGRWLNEMLANQADEKRIALLWFFNRTVRASHDPYETMKETLEHLNKELPEHYKTFSRRPRR